MLNLALAFLRPHFPNGSSFSRFISEMYSRSYTGVHYNPIVFPSLTCTLQTYQHILKHYLLKNKRKWLNTNTPWKVLGGAESNSAPHRIIIFGVGGLRWWGCCQQDCFQLVLCTFFNIHSIYSNFPIVEHQLSCSWPNLECLSVLTASSSPSLSSIFN